MFMDDQVFLSFDSIPSYRNSSFRTFLAGERHVTRTINEDVILLVISGTLCFSENGTPLRITAGQYYIQRAGRFQEGIVESDSPKYFYSHFSGNYTNDPSGIPFFGNFSFTELKDFFYKLDYAQKSPNSTKFEKTTLFFELLQKLKHSTAIAKEKFPLAKKIEEILVEKYTQELSLVLLEKQLGYTKDYLIRTFRQAYGITPYQYVADLRMNQARQLLLTTNRTVSRIAEDCGYRDLSVFYRAFAQMHGSSPKCWKKAMLSPDSAGSSFH